jgi:O-antigen ligase/tetratricopeptide (TPR) repeat protein
MRTQDVPPPAAIENMDEGPRGRLPVRQSALAIALVYFILVGGTNIGTYAVPFAVINAVLATVLVALWLVELPRRNDLTDRTMLVGLLLFLLTCMTSAFPRMSFDAATSVTTWAAAFGIARGELTSARAERALFTVLAICGGVLAAGFLASWIPQWVNWWRETGTIPPLDLPLRPGPYRHYHVAAMLLGLLLPALLQFRQRQRVGVLAWIAIVAGLAGVYMSGSRTVWVALSVVGIVAFLPRLRLRPAVIAATVVIASSLVALALAGALVSTSSRLLTTLTVSIRGETWSSSLAGWLERPLFGWGPGSFAAVFRFREVLPVFPEPGGHAHNVVVQVLLEAGVVGLVALLVAILALAVGIRRNPRRSPYALMGLAVLGLMSLADLPSNFPMVLVIGVCWAALAAPRIAEAKFEPAPRCHRWPIAASVVMGGTIVAAVASTLVGWAAFDEARMHLLHGDRSGARLALARAVAFDPGMALYWRERGIRAAEAGDGSDASSDLRRALQLNDRDTTTLRALAVLDVDDGRFHEAKQLARRAVALWGTRLENQMVLAWVAKRSGDEALAGKALTGALTWYPWAAAAPTWTAVFGHGIAMPAEQAADVWQANGRERSWEATWLRAMAAHEPLNGLPPSFAAVSAIIQCDLPLAAAYLAETGTAALSAASLAPRFMLAGLTDDEDAYRNALAVAILRGSQLAILARRDPGPASPFSDSAQDLGLYRRIPLMASQMEPILPTAGEGLAAWLRDPRGAARRGAPGSGLASCAT